MTSFIDGPAAGKHLLLRRTPIFLRVVESAGKWDALDQIGDEPRPTERIYAYQAHAIMGSCHINAGRGRSGFYTVVDYKLVPDQPTELQLRNTADWRKWCIAHDPRPRGALKGGV